MKLEELGIIVAIVVGIFGITQTVFQILRIIVKERRRIKVTCEETDEPWPDMEEDKNPQAIAIKQSTGKYKAITIRALNISQEPIIIVAAGFQLSNGRKIEFPNIDINHPTKIGYGENAIFSFGKASLAKQLAKQNPRPANINSYFILLDDMLPKILRRLWRGLVGMKDLRFRSPFYYDFVVDTKVKEDIGE